MSNRSHVPFVLVLIISYVVSPRYILAQAELERFFPSAVQAGVTSTVKAEGKFPTWPTTARSDRTDLIVAAATENGQFKISVPAGAAAGIGWVRLTDSAGASSLVPLIVSPVAVLTETEPNDQLSTATIVQMPATAAGKLEKNGDVDAYRIKLEAGQTLVANVIANRILKSPMDSVLQLTDHKGNVLLQSDDVRGLDPRIVYKTKATGDYYLRVFAFPETPNSTIGFAGASNFVYLIEVTVGAYLESVMPLALLPNASADSFQVLGWTNSNSAQSILTKFPGRNEAQLSLTGALGWQSVPFVAQHTSVLTEQQLESAGASDVVKPVALPAVLTGVIQRPKEVDVYPVAVKSGTRYRVEVHSRELGFPVDSAVTVTAEDGKELASNDDSSGNDYDAATEFTAPTDGLARIAIRDITDAYSPSHIYVARVSPVTAEFDLKVDADHFQITAGSTLDLSVNIARTGGMNGELEIVATDLPLGVTCAVVESAAKGDSSKKVVLKLVADERASVSGDIRISGKEKSTGSTAVTAREATFQLRDSYSLSQFWLTVIPKKAN